MGCGFTKVAVYKQGMTAPQPLSLADSVQAEAPEGPQMFFAPSVN